MTSYDEACQAAADYQGLTPIMAELKRAGVRHELYQSGGFCMIVTVPRPGNTVDWITADENEEGWAVITIGHICHRDDWSYDNCPGCHGGGYIDTPIDGVASFYD